MSKLIFRCTASNDKDPIKIGKEDYHKIEELACYLINKYAFEFEGGGFYIEDNIKPKEQLI